jgi:hypothetical protein
MGLKAKLGLGATRVILGRTVLPHHQHRIRILEY